MQAPMQAPMQATKIPRFSFEGLYLPVEINHIHDGDTVDIICRPIPGFYTTNTEGSVEIKTAGLFRISCRMARYNSAEIRSKDPVELKAAEAARDRLVELCHVSNIKPGTQLYGKLGKNDKYGRCLLELYIHNVVDVNQMYNDYLDCTFTNKPTLKPVNVNDLMMSGGYGKPYSGSGEKTW